MAAADAVLARLVEVVEGCLHASPDSRPSAAQLVDALTALRLDVDGHGGQAAVSGHTTTAAVPRTSTTGATPVLTGDTYSTSESAPASAVYDTIALLDGLHSVGVEDAVVDAVADAVGHLAVCALDVLRPCGVPPRKAIAVRALLSPRSDSALVRHQETLAHSVPSLRVSIKSNYPSSHPSLFLSHSRTRSHVHRHTLAFVTVPAPPRAAKRLHR